MTDFDNFLKNIQTYWDNLFNKDISTSEACAIVQSLLKYSNDQKVVTIILNPNIYFAYKSVIMNIMDIEESNLLDFCVEVLYKRLKNGIIYQEEKIVLKRIEELISIKHSISTDKRSSLIKFRNKILKENL